MDKIVIYGNLGDMKTLNSDSAINTRKWINAEILFTKSWILKSWNYLTPEPRATIKIFSLHPTGLAATQHSQGLQGHKAWQNSEA